METDTLYRDLKDAYTEENLHRISSFIIDLFREKKFDALRYIQRVVNEHTPCSEVKINKIFSKLIMLYHPDRLKQAISMIDEAMVKNDFETIYSHAHILQVLHLKPDDIPVTAFVMDEDLAEEFGWDQYADGMYYREEEDETDPWEQEMDILSGNSFLTAVKRKVYGSMNVEFPAYLLEDLEEVEMSEYEIENLEGIELCKYARIVDLSNNNLTDITELRDLVRIERLYLSNNQIGFIDALYHLRDLQVVDLSFNDIDDISPLFELEALEYVNLIGNRIPGWQMEKLELNGVTVVA